jgi:hypothetical protein
VTELLDRMLDGFDATYGARAPRSVLVSTAARDALAVSRGFSDAGPADAPRDRAMTPVGWYRGVPIDLVTHDREWLIAVIATRSTGTSAPALYGDVRSGKISSTFPQRSR